MRMYAKTVKGGVPLRPGKVSLPRINPLGSKRTPSGFFPATGGAETMGKNYAKNAPTIGDIRFGDIGFGDTGLTGDS